jgi:2-polyprenyl-3-methyl-5-hydroxy-6-metoxy-1,4-benzoquinol methylase
MEENRNQSGNPQQCLLCGGRNHRVVFHELGVDILQCRDCRHVFSSYQADPHHDGYWGEEVADGDQFYWRDARGGMHQDFCRRFLAGRSGRLLDMGCGLGFFLKAVKRHPGWEAHGCEISPAAVRYARETLGLSNVVCGRLEDADLPPGSFDFITIWDVLEHLLLPDPLLTRCHALLKEGGICFIYTPNVNIQLARARGSRMLRRMRPGDAYLQARDHSHHYSTSSIRRLLNRNGFSSVEFVHLQPVQGVGNNRSEFLRVMKNFYCAAARGLAFASGGILNIDNLFVVARKGFRT